MMDIDGSREGAGGPDPPGKSQVAIGFLRNTGTNRPREYSKTRLKPTLKKTKICFQDQLSLNAGQKYGILQYF